jgi:hypothetical protein
MANASKFGHKFLFLTYDGVDDPLPWLNRCEQFFWVQEPLLAGKVFLATFYVTVEASQWYTILEWNRGTPSEFTQLINNRFGPPLRSNPLGELIQLRWDGTITKYQGKVLALLTCCEDLMEKH